MNTTENMMVKGFSGSRFNMLLKSDWLINKGTYIKMIIVALGVFVAISLLVSIDAMDELNKIEVVKTEHTITDLSSGGIESSIENFNQEDLNIDRRKIFMTPLLAIGFWLFCLGMTIFGSLTFSCLSSKRQRINTFMLPASISEKYFLHMLIYLGGGTLLLILGYALSILIAHFTFGGGLAVSEMISNLPKIPYVGYIIAIVSLMVLFGNSIFTLGSSLWPKLSWLKTQIVIMVFQWIVGIILISGLLSGFNFDMIIDWLTKRMTPEIGFWSAIIILFGLNLTCWIIAWRRFKSTQIVQKFMRK